MCVCVCLWAYAFGWMRPLWCTGCTDWMSVLEDLGLQLSSMGLQRTQVQARLAHKAVDQGHT